MSTKQGKKRTIAATVLSFNVVLSELTSLFDIHDNYTDVLVHTRTDCPTIPRECRSMASIFAEYGPYYSHRAYRMDQASFYQLHNLLRPFLARDSKKPVRGSPPNGEINTELKLSVALRYFAGGDVYDIMISHELVTVVFGQWLML